MTSNAALLTARDDLLAGRAGDLDRAVSADPRLIADRVRSDRPPYDGYFHGATLLHHVAANPFIAPLPPDIVSLTRLLIERGAEVDSVTLQGPSQPNDIGWTTLGLAATSAEARKAGVQLELMDLLIAAGADVDARNGGCMMGALYYGESEAARHLARRGARLDLIAAAGLGDLERMHECLTDDYTRLVHYGLAPRPTDSGLADELGLALCYAALHGQVGAIDLLLEHGADPNHRPPFDHGGTALHWAAMGDRDASVRRLLEAGADPTVRDRSFESTPLGWAEYMGRPKAAAALRAE